MSVSKGRGIQDHRYTVYELQLTVPTLYHAQEQRRGTLGCRQDPLCTRRAELYAYRQGSLWIYHRLHQSITRPQDERSGRETAWAWVSRAASSARWSTWNPHWYANWRSAEDDGARCRTGDSGSRSRYRQRCRRRTLPRTKFAYLSSGTWSLMGIETKDAIINDLSYERNFTNEGGIEGTTRFLKNICGMWLLERCRKEWTDAPKSYSDLLSDAMAKATSIPEHHQSRRRDVCQPDQYAGCHTRIL